MKPVLNGIPDVVVESIRRYISLELLYYYVSKVTLIVVCDLPRLAIPHYNLYRHLS